MSHITLQSGDYVQLANGAVIGPMVGTSEAELFLKVVPPGTTGRFPLQGHEDAAWDLRGQLVPCGTAYRDPAAFRVIGATQDYKIARAWFMMMRRKAASNGEALSPSDKHALDAAPYIAAMASLQDAVENLTVEMRKATASCVTIKPSLSVTDLAKLREAAAGISGIIQPYSSTVEFHRKMNSPDEIEIQIPASENPEGGLSDVDGNDLYPANLNRMYGKMATRPPSKEPRWDECGKARAAASKVPQDTLERLYADFPTEESVAPQREDWYPPAEEYERRADGKIVRKDRFETGFRNIVSIIVGPRVEWEVDDIVERIRTLADLGKGHRADPDFIKGRYRRWIDNDADKNDLISGLEDAFTAGFSAGEQDEIARQKRLAEESKQDEPDHLPWRRSDIERGLILFRTSNNAHGYTNVEILSERVDALPQEAKEELANVMFNIAAGMTEAKNLRQPLRWRVWWQGSANPRGAYIFAIDRHGRSVNQVMYVGEDNDLAHKIVDAHNLAIDKANPPERVAAGMTEVRGSTQAVNSPAKHNANFIGVDPKAHRNESAPGLQVAKDGHANPAERHHGEVSEG